MYCLSGLCSVDPPGWTVSLLLCCTRRVSFNVILKYRTLKGWWKKLLISVSRREEMATPFTNKCDDGRE